MFVSYTYTCIYASDTYLRLRRYLRDFRNVKFARDVCKYVAQRKKLNTDLFSKRDTIARRVLTLYRETVNYYLEPNVSPRTFKDLLNERHRLVGEVQPIQPNMYTLAPDRKS